MNPAVIVIGAGVNELACAHCLARAGARVTVLEENDPPADEPFEPGWVPPALVGRLGLQRHGLQFHEPDPWIAAPLAQGGRLELARDVARSAEAIRRLSPKDAGRWPAFCERMARLARLLEALYAARPPDPLGRGPGDLARLARAALSVRRLGRTGIEDFLRLLPMPVADLLDDWFESDVLKGLLGAAGVIHLHQGPRAGGTALAFLHHHAGSPAGVFRPPSSNLRHVLARLPGIEIRRGSKAACIDVRAGAVSGVVLASGEQLPGSLVVSGAGPRRTLLELADPAWLDPDFARAVRQVRSRGVAGQVSLALDRAPGFTRLAVAPSLEYLERAHDDAKYARVSRQPWIEARDLGRGADGKHRLALHLQYAPHALREGAWDESRRAALGELALRVLFEHAPELRASVLGSNAFSPRDLQELAGLPEGQPYHAELALDQFLWMRPLPGWADYRTPIGGLYLCGPGTHPGAGVAGASGLNCARVVLGKLRQRGA